jgi:hypothetical protein
LYCTRGEKKIFLPEAYREPRLNLSATLKTPTASANIGFSLCEMMLEIPASSGYYCKNLNNFSAPFLPHERILRCLRGPHDEIPPKVLIYSTGI